MGTVVSPCSAQRCEPAFPPRRLGRAVPVVAAAAQGALDAHGFAEDYGRADLVLGRRALGEIFPRVEAFLSEHASRV
jgi:hypothetical protein